MALAATTLVRDVIELILRAKKDQKLLMIITLWFLWNERNLIIEGHRRGAEFLARCIKSYTNENSVGLNDNSVISNSAHRPKDKWRKAPRGFLKFGCDASFLPSSMSGSRGFFIQDSDGDVIVSGRGKRIIFQMLSRLNLIVCL